MTQRPSAGEVVFNTEWFQIVSQAVAGSARPHYLIRAPDFASVVALTAQKQLLLVRQYRPALGRTTLELPAGHIDNGELPETAARRELLEETGYEADALDLLCTLSPGTSRFTNRLWCYFAANVRPAAEHPPGDEPHIQLVLYEGGVRSLMAEKDFLSTGNYAALFAAVVQGRVPI